MLQRTRLQSRGFKKPQERVRQRDLPPGSIKPAKTLHTATMAGGTSGQAVEKENASQSEAYMAAVRNLGYCMRCACTCRPQFCHRDEGKGGSIKTDVRLGWPGCDACHSLLGGHAGGGRMPKQQRRAEEEVLAQRTRAAILASGTWPKRLERWTE